jgi:hypothetical protein
MKFQLGAMTVGDILDRGLKVLLAKLPTFYAINMLVIIPVFAINLFLPLIMQGGAGESPLKALLLGLGTIFSAIIILLILQPLATGAILHVIAQDFVNRDASIGDALKFSMGRLGKLVGTSILGGLIIGVGYLMCVIPGILFAVWYAFITQIVVVEGLAGDKALSRSKKLGSGFYGRIFAMTFLFGVLIALWLWAQVLLDDVIPTHGTPVVAAGREPEPLGGAAVVPESDLEDFASGEFYYHNYVIQQVIDFLVRVLIQSYSAVCWTLLYFDLRIRKEGFDLELALQPGPTAVH